MGELEGPIKSKFGHHLLLVTERTNCPKLDGPSNKLIQTNEDDLFGTRVTGSQDGKVTSDFVLTQAGYWFLILIAGGILAEIVASMF